MNYNLQTTEILVIGSGLVGLNAAYEAAKRGAKVTVIYKGLCSASPEVMGFNAPIHPQDSPELFYEEIMKGGEGINNTKLAHILAEKSMEQIPKMEGLGLVFARNEDGTYNGMKALGNTYPRIAHYKALTGVESMRLLRDECEKMGVEFCQGQRAVDLISDGENVFGCVAIDKENKLTVYKAKCTVLATGGLSNMHTISTYPKGLIGDGYAMALKAGAKLIDMEFTQFEPCCIVYPEVLWGKLIVTTMLNEGGKLLNDENREFLVESGVGYKMQKCELSRAIVDEIRRGHGTEHGGVWMDVTALPHDRVAIDNSIFYNPPKQAGIDITEVPVEVAPAAHTFMGGVQIDEHCRTNLHGLLAAGEVTGGVHGANRLGGCAGAEVFVFGSLVGVEAAKFVKEETVDDSNFDALVDLTLDPTVSLLVGGSKDCDLKSLHKELSNEIMKGLGIYRDEKSMMECLKALNKYDECIHGIGGDQFNDRLDIENMILMARVQLIASLERKESRGVFARTDYPVKDDENWKKNIGIQFVNNELSVMVENVK